MNENEIDKPYIESRVSDWLKRIDDLYESVRTNLSNSRNVKCATSRTMMMHEELMRKFNVPSVHVPILDVIKNDKILVTFKPVGLWVVGANGRVDILSEKGAYILVDTAGKGRAAEWRIYTPTNRKKATAFNRSFLEQLVK